MIRKFNIVGLLFIASFSIVSCSDSEDKTTTSKSENTPVLSESEKGTVVSEEASTNTESNELVSMEYHFDQQKMLKIELETAFEMKSVDQFGDEFSPNWNRSLMEKRESFEGEFGSNIKEYKGKCHDAFFAIGINYSYLRNLWSGYLSAKQGKKSNIEEDMNVVEGYISEAETALETCKGN